MQPSELQIPPPQDWQAFERLCRDLWSEIWNAPDTQLNGCGGQSQDGVDIFGQPEGGREWAGVQCKLRDQRRGHRLRPSDVQKEAAKALQFDPPLTNFVIATTACRDSKAQDAARKITDDEGLQLKVSVVAWEDILGELGSYPRVFDKHFPNLSSSRGRELTLARDRYLRSMWGQLHPLRLLGVTAHGADRESVSLATIYTQLDVTDEIEVTFEEGLAERATFFYRKYTEEVPIVEHKMPIRLSGKRGQLLAYLETVVARSILQAQGRKIKPTLDLLRTARHRRRWSALEAAGAYPRLVLHGPAGSGKSTFGRHLALCMAGEYLGKIEANVPSMNRLPRECQSEMVDIAPWPHGPMLPLFVELRRFVASEIFSTKSQPGSAEELLRFVTSELPEASGRIFREMLEECLVDRSGGAILILDGLDEVPGAEQVRQRLKEVVTSFVALYPECRVLLTCRPYAYAPDSLWRLDTEGFVETSLAPFDDDKISTFIRGWHGALEARGQIDRAQALRQSQSLTREIRDTDYLQPLAKRPLMLTMIADLYASSGGRPAGGRAGLYEESTRLLLDRWNASRGILGNTSIAGHLGMTEREIRRALEALAYKIQKKGGRSSAQDAADITVAELWEAIDAERRPPAEQRVDEGRVREYLQQRSGILIAESSSLFRFPHRSYQEYLAGCHLRQREFPPRLLRELENDPELWREVLQFVVAQLESTPFAVWALLDALVPCGPDRLLTSRAAIAGRLAYYAALAVRENELWLKVQSQDIPKLGRIVQWLRHMLANSGELSLAEWAESGRILGVLGDPRLGTGCSGGLPEIDWVEVPQGEFLMGRRVHDHSTEPTDAANVRVEIPAYSISRYPVTNSQFDTFVEDGGYLSEWRHCWNKAGWRWKDKRRGPDHTVPAEWLLPNLPRAGVSWFEATAFCKWLGEKLGQGVRLPTDEEWEKAARGCDGRIYPWGNEFSVVRCNCMDLGIDMPTAVGSFENGASPYGLLDMSGNVWEWCDTKWESTHQKRREYSPRILRGGSFGNDRDFLRCTKRFRHNPGDNFRLWGFRVAVTI